MAAIGDFVQVRVFSQFDEQIAINRYYYKVTAVAIPGASAQDIADGWSRFMANLYPPMLPNVAFYLGVQVQTMAPTPGLAATSNSLASVGAVAVDPLPRQVAAIITWRDGNPTRQGRGRTYWPFPTTNDVQADGHPDPAYLGSLDAIAFSLMTPTIATATPTNIYTAALHLRHPGRVPEYTQVTAKNVSTLWGTQRRRGDQGQPNRPPTGL